SIVVAIGLVVYVVRNPNHLWIDTVLGLVLGGTLGNGYDRIMFGTVTDFINFHFWPVFNVADASISIGVVALIAGYLLRKPTA
ncbi:MAG: signal peptidase II, partial [Chloroflexota bacterium]|nr:signal peptidase II [Chloroflexota bacterium]